jgi:hypothetical protein
LLELAQLVELELLQQLVLLELQRLELLLP